MAGRQRGVAVVTALMLTTLAITIVASLFWQQQVQVRLVENQRYQLQKQWVLRGALDWSRLILREDASLSTTDHLAEPWAVPLAPTRLDDYVENRTVDNDVGAALLSGGIVDAQSRFNLTNLATQGTVNLDEVKAFKRLLVNLDVTEAIAEPIAEAVAASQPRSGLPPQSDGPGAGGTPGSGNAAGNAGNSVTGTNGTNGTNGTARGAALPSATPSMPLIQVEDLLALPGMNAEILAKLRDYVVILPTSTAVNANTASAPVLSARIEGFSLPEAAALVAARERAYFLNEADLQNRLPQGANLGSQVSLTTDYFIVNGTVRLGRGALDMQALVHRQNKSTALVWMREN